MKKILAVVLVMVICCGLVGCDTTYTSEERFDIVHEEGSQTIVVDEETGVMYLFCQAGYAGGMTVMVDADGNPLLYEEESDG